MFKKDFYRAKDLVHLRFYFFNLEKVGASYLKAEDKTKPCYVAVRFPQQHVAEQSFKNLNTIDTAVSRLSGYTWLSFEVKINSFPFKRLPYDFKTLTNWSSSYYKLMLAGKDDFLDASGNPALPADYSYPLQSPYISAAGYPITLIEAPYRLYIAPTEISQILIEVPSEIKELNEFAEQWRTSLLPKKSETYFPIRVVQTPDAFLTPAERQQVDAPFEMGDRTILPKAQDRVDFYLANLKYLKPVNAKYITLGSQGASLDFEVNATGNIPTGHYLYGWRQLMELMRDHDVNVARIGVLYPFGIKAILVQMTRRKYHNHPTVGAAAPLHYREFVLPVETTKDYPLANQPHAAASGAVPRFAFGKLSIVESKLIPIKKRAIAGITVDLAFWPDLEVDGSPLQFPFEAIDHHQAASAFRAAFIFVSKEVYEKSATEFESLKKDISKGYTEVIDGVKRSSIDFYGQVIGYAPQFNTADFNNQFASLKTELMDFTGDMKQDFYDSLPTIPNLVEARVTIPAINDLLDSAVTVGIQYSQMFLKDPELVDNYTKAYAEITQQSKALLTDLFKQKTRDLGGLASMIPAVDYLGIRKDMQLIRQQLAQYATIPNQFDIRDFVDENMGKLFGSITLTDIFSLQSLDNLPHLDYNIPKDITYRWETTQLESKDPFIKGAESKFSLYAEVKTSTGRFLTESSLKDFSLSVKGFLTIAFNNVSFRKESGKKEDIRVDIKNVEFQGSLAFLNAFAGKRFSITENSVLTITPFQIQYNLNIAVPEIGGAMFIFSNLKFGMEATLPFLYGNAMRWKIFVNEEFDKFSVIVGLFTGRGYFLLVFESGRITETEIAMEYGGTLALSVGVASGSAFLAAGFYYGCDSSGITYKAYIVCGGHLSIIGLISLTIVFYLGLMYNSNVRVFEGFCVVSVRVKILFFKKTFHLRYQKRIAGTQQKLISTILPLKSRDAKKSRKAKLAENTELEHALKIWNDYADCFA